MSKNLSLKETKLSYDQNIYLLSKSRTKYLEQSKECSQV